MLPAPLRFAYPIRMLLALSLLTQPVSAMAQPAALTAEATTPTEQTDRALRAYLTRFRVPGAQIAVVKDGAIVFSRAYGSANLAFETPATTQTVFTLASITKAFTGVAAMQAVEAGKFDLAAPISLYLDGLPEAWRAITVRQLLSHTSGLPDINRAPTIETDATQAWNWALAQPVLFAPGERFHYCQTNYTLIQRALNRVYGREPDAMLADAQLAAEGMRSTRYGDSRDVIVGKGPDYQFVRATPGVAGVLEQRYPVSLPFKRASNGLVSSAEEVARWLIALEQGKLLGPQALATMWTPVAFNDGRAGQWGIGWTILPRGAGHRAVGMTGGARSAFYLYPEDRVAVVILTNLAGAYPEDEIDRIAGYWAPALRPSGVSALRIALDDTGYHRAVRTAREIAKREPSLQWNELELNDWGYRLLHSGRPRDGLAIMKLVATLFPRSGNAQDSLGEAHAINGENALAVVHYRRSLALDPGNANAAKQIERLQKQRTGKH